MTLRGVADIVPNIEDWKVIDTETLSDHSLIELAIRGPMAADGLGSLRRMGQDSFPRWSSKNMDHDLLKASIILKDWLCPQPRNCKAEVAAIELGKLLEQSCDVAAPRTKKLPLKRQTYWWTRDLAEKQSKCTAIKRKMVKSRRRGNLVDAEMARIELRVTQRSLRVAIAEAKNKAWQELLATLH